MVAHTKTKAVAPLTAREPKQKAKAKAKAEPQEQDVSTSHAEQDRKGKRKAKSEPEKRAARYRSSCPQTVESRRQRAIGQRMYFVGREQVGASQEFKIIGSVGNVYTTVISTEPTCDCPDAEKGNTCKHLIFTFLKVLKVPVASDVWYQKALLPSELEAVFANAPPNPTDVVSRRAREAYKLATGQTEPDDANDEAQDDANMHKRRLPSEGDSCPICYEEFSESEITDGTGLVFCAGTEAQPGCGNGLHAACQKQWQKRGADKSGSCVFCRAPFGSDAFPLGEDSTTYNEGYLNVSEAAGLSTERDTSTYYSRPFFSQDYRQTGRRRKGRYRHWRS
ncbi:uncharacterized protein L969DRAFT_46584 [Mixia osmundae IAM 14324]|uniref:SWIM-type domain-containing protein n=1 Tax=Mixia osmundae (strain CBS 9802 / IAM 14324 / JCM 22182 / KY 12970) TaxID=764103 RepID=G7E5B8_MIXOS|nr:uncharacterized protein L969DRAFT_46584 [Mixia osmundae IAM 14324]KEI40822.1 hypothetical protein L969DRAFT_46584 [Mixia osmundae IAM 14324]GAA98028.1 hypothetical protein E5Q_04708 [Mixia osmundae IAM 14324]